MPPNDTMTEGFICTVNYVSENDFDKGRGSNMIVVREPAPLGAAFLAQASMIVKEYHHPGHTIVSVSMEAKINGKYELVPEGSGTIDHLPEDFIQKLESVLRKTNYKETVRE